MLLHPLPSLLIPFSRTFIIKINANNDRISPSFHFLALMTPFPVVAFINKEAIGTINEEAIGAINEAAIDTKIAPRNPPSCSFISCFTVLVLLFF